MDWVWSLGENSGFPGHTLDYSMITCPFCSSDGNFSVAGTIEKAHSGTGKLLHYDTLKCGNCGNYIQVLWGAGLGYHDFIQQPRDGRLRTVPAHYPADVGRFWLQAKNSLSQGHLDAAILTARAALQLALRSQDLKRSSLQKEIASFAEQGQLPPIMREWADNVRLLGNDSAHPTPNQPEPDRKDAEDIIHFLDFLLEYLYTLPKRIEKYYSRKASEPA